MSRLAPAAIAYAILLLFPCAVRGEHPDERPDAVIQRARSAAATYFSDLPNFVCRQATNWYMAPSLRSNWRPADVIAADLVYEDGREQYRNVTLNGKATRRSIEDLPVNWSVGEFASGLVQVLSPVSDAEFQFKTEIRFAGRDAYLYDYSVRREMSQWELASGVHKLAPAYRGSIWIDKATWRVLRVEKRPEGLPSNFGWEAIQSATDYRFVTLGSEQFLLPVRAEFVGCELRVRHCIRSVTEFRDYRRFASESTVTFNP